MIEKENDLEIKGQEMKEHMERKESRYTQLKDDQRRLIEQLDRGKKENENLRELIKLKDKQVQEQNDTEDLIRQMQKDNKDLKNQVTKKDFEMREVVKALKSYSDEKSRLEKELEKLHKENESLVGHKNPSQKI